MDERDPSPAGAGTGPPPAPGAGWAGLAPAPGPRAEVPSNRVVPMEPGDAPPPEPVGGSDAHGGRPPSGKGSPAPRGGGSPQRPRGSPGRGAPAGRSLAKAATYARNAARSRGFAMHGRERIERKQVAGDGPGDGPGARGAVRDRNWVAALERRESVLLQRMARWAEQEFGEPVAPSPPRGKGAPEPAGEEGPGEAREARRPPVFGFDRMPIAVQQWNEFKVRRGRAGPSRRGVPAAGRDAPPCARA